VHEGGIIRMDTTKKEIYLVFTGHEFADGAETILKTLRHHNVKASFFFTGDFYRNAHFNSMIKKLKSDGHYLGAHSDRHLLYCSWEKRDSLIVDKQTFMSDIAANYVEMEKFGVTKHDAPYFIPPYEWYNKTISQWAGELGLQIINFTPGTSSNADYTTPEMPNYVSSDTIVQRVLRYESSTTSGLNGFLLLSHIGTEKKRTDKFYDKLDNLITVLKRKGYVFKRL
jgi:peptidoglycan/xylan/chitin deacetylase (PgdA/CDA1 family)